MTTRIERWLLDTNVWIFGLRRDENFPESARVLDEIGSFVVLVPLQVTKELHLNLTDDEMRDFYRLLNRFSERAELNWHTISAERVRFYEQQGCRKGDAIVAASAEALGADVIVSNNRQFLQTLSKFPANILTPAQALLRLFSTNAE